MTPVSEFTLGRFVVVLRLVLETDEGLGRVAMADGRAGLVAAEGLGLVAATEGLRFLTGRFFWVVSVSLSGFFLLTVTGGLA